MRTSEIAAKQAPAGKSRTTAMGRFATLRLLLQAHSEGLGVWGKPHGKRRSGYRYEPNPSDVLRAYVHSPAIANAGQ